MDGKDMMLIVFMIIASFLLFYGGFAAGKLQSKAEKELTILAFTRHIANEHRCQIKQAQTELAAQQPRGESGREDKVL
jgi:hypothetical protein